MAHRPFNGPRGGEPVDGTWPADDVCNRCTSTPGTCDKPGPSSTPTTDVFGAAIGGRAATVFPAGPPQIQLTSPGIESFASDQRAHTPDAGAEAATVAPKSGPRACSQQVLSSPAAAEPSQPLPAPLSAAGLQPFAERMFASGMGEPVAAEGDFGSVELSKGLVLSAGNAIIGCSPRRLSLHTGPPVAPPAARGVAAGAAEVI